MKKSFVAGAVEIHEMTMENDVMKMREIPSLDLPAGHTVELKPGGYHVMPLDLKWQMVSGTSVPIKLVFETSAGKRFTLDIEAPVSALGATPKGMLEPQQHQSPHGHRH